MGNAYIYTVHLLPLVSLVLAAVFIWLLIKDGPVKIISYRFFLLLAFLSVAFVSLFNLLVFIAGWHEWMLKIWFIGKFISLPLSIASMAVYVSFKSEVRYYLVVTLGIIFMAFSIWTVFSMVDYTLVNLQTVTVDALTSPVSIYVPFVTFALALFLLLGPAVVFSWQYGRRYTGFYRMAGITMFMIAALWPIFTEILTGTKDLLIRHSIQICIPPILFLGHWLMKRDGIA